MSLFKIEPRDLFFLLFKAKNEEEVDKIIQNYPEIFTQENWYPYGANESYFGVIENQQASPIPALIEKITNSIDAILMKRCYESGVDPKSDLAPQTMEEAIRQYFPNSKQWDLPLFRKIQAENIQIIADGPRMDTSLIIYDDGEGQNPEDFEDTFLSLLKGNKNEIKFVQGKYNMGGSGALVFCGKKRYHLIASKKFDNKGEFGLTLFRQHPFTAEEEIKSPFVLEFLGLKDEYSETDLEEALINHLGAFLLELGSDFAFVARQKRLRLDDTWYRVDLVFFHRRLRSLLLIDLKIGEFTHADAGQMHLYLNYAREHWTHADENPPVGLILCAKKSENVVKYALENLPNKVVAAEYLTALPEEKLIAEELEKTQRMLDLRSM